MTNQIEKPKKNSALTFNSFHNEKRDSWTLANVDGVYYLFRGRSFSMIVNAIKENYKPLMDTLQYKGKNFNKVIELTKNI